MKILPEVAAELLTDVIEASIDISGAKIALRALVTEGGFSISEGILEAIDFTNFNEDNLSSGAIVLRRTEISSRSSFIIFNIAIITLKTIKMCPKKEFLLF